MWECAVCECSNVVSIDWNKNRNTQLKSIRFWQRKMQRRKNEKKIVLVWPILSELGTITTDIHTQMRRLEMTYKFLFEIQKKIYKFVLMAASRLCHWMHGCEFARWSIFWLYFFLSISLSILFIRMKWPLLFQLFLRWNKCFVVFFEFFSRVRQLLSMVCLDETARKCTTHR